MSDSYKKIGSSSQTLLQKIAERHAIRQKEEAETIAREKAEFDALPEEEKQRILAQREQERLDQERKIAEQEREEQIQKWKRRGIPPRFYDETWDTWTADTPEKKEAKEKIRQAWKKNLFIIGENGAGKTHLAMCLVKEGATYCKTAELFRSVREDLSIEQETVDNYGECRLLILDEAGRQKRTDFERNLLFEIIDKRWNNMLPTTIIGNIGKGEFADLYGLAVLDRLRPEIVEMNWESKRTIFNQEETK
jgi:DNA replication protein DnaC